MRPTALATLLAVLPTSCGEPAAAPPAEPSAPATSAAARAPAHAKVPEGPAAPAGPVDLGAGLTLEVQERGTGPEVRPGRDVAFHYRAFLEGQDEPFDSSRERLAPARARPGTGSGPRLVQGLERGLLALREGDRATLRVPPALGWGAAGQPALGVPPDAALVYEVHVLEVH